MSWDEKFMPGANKVSGAVNPTASALKKQTSIKEYFSCPKNKILMAKNSNENPRLMSYIVTWDGGLAPNPYWESCTLAVCKPQIRKTAKEGDWIVGLSPKRFGNELVYAMLVAQTLSFSEYFQEPRFSTKKPDLKSDDPPVVAGDNFYQPLANDKLLQLPSLHSNEDGSENVEHKTRDLSGVFVLAALEFYYYGENTQPLPTELSSLIVGRGHRVIKDQKTISNFRRHMDKNEAGIHGNPKLLGQR